MHAYYAYMCNALLLVKTNAMPAAGFVHKFSGACLPYNCVTLLLFISFRADPCGCPPIPRCSDIVKLYYLVELAALQSDRAERAKEQKCMVYCPAVFCTGP